MKNTIELSLSKQFFTEKPNHEEIKQIIYNNKIALTTEELISKLKEGHAITHIFTNNNTFTQRDKTIDNFKYTYFIPVDIDDSEIDIYSYIDKLNLKPTIGYTTYSNLKEGKGYRFRLIYVFNEKIENKELYKELYKAITSTLNLKDNCMQSVAQQSYGTTNNAETYISNNIYNIVDVLTENKKCNSNSIIEREENIIKLEMHFYEKYNKEFLSDYFNFSYTDFLKKYSNIYPFFNNTQIKYTNEDTPFILLPENYLEIKRYWLLDKDIDNETGEIIRTSSRVRKIKNGEHRRKKLFINAILRRFIMPDISAEYMLTMLINELYYYIDNREDIITKKDLFNICNNALKANLNDYKALTKQKHSNFIVNDEYCIKYNVSRKQARNIAKKILNYNKIGNLYDINLTDKENIKIMKENGLNISLRTLKNFKKENGLTKEYNKKCNSNSIIEEERNIIKLEMHFSDTEKENTIDEQIEDYYKFYNDDIWKEHCNNIINDILNNKSENDNKINNEEIEIVNMENKKLENNIAILYNRFSKIKNENELNTKYNLFIDYIEKHKEEMNNIEYKNNIDKIEKMKDYILAMYSENFMYFVDYCEKYTA